ncbi:MAG: BlaI/MecI/CopY family transcriptional regulator [Lachnospiraceae bacterium]|nr:BlaI/MecI/CopY family transcriptional regulator [Lachnospiraceae bacterium]
MAEIQLGVVESRFAELIWEREPITSHELVKLTAEEFGWARTTTHNVIRKLCEKGLFQNNKGTVTSVLSREEFYARQSRQFVENSFAGSLPAFLSAFTKGTRLTEEEAEEIRKIIEEAKGE